MCWCESVQSESEEETRLMFTQFLGRERILVKWSDESSRVESSALTASQGEGKKNNDNEKVINTLVCVRYWDSEIRVIESSLIFLLCNLLTIGRKKFRKKVIHLQQWYFTRIFSHASNFNVSQALWIRKSQSLSSEYFSRWTLEQCVWAFTSFFFLLLLLLLFFRG